MLARSPQFLLAIRHHDAHGKFGAGRRNREDYGDRCSFFADSPADKEIPDITVIRNSHRRGLHGIDH